MDGMSLSALLSRLQKSPQPQRLTNINEDLQKNFTWNSKLNEELFARVPTAKVYSYIELQTASGNFSPENKIGEGGYGSVYKGRLADGTLVAMKILSAESEQGTPEFLKEIDVLSGLDHVNLVKFYGSCSEGPHRILVYDYLEKNSLAQTLLGENCNKLEFSWEVRARICIGLAEGFAFLHEVVKPRIIHRDIKPSNVLLGDDFTPKISDFGLARIFPNSMTHLNTKPVGTPGYYAPEYYFTGRLSSKADVYSNGVLLLEIVTGRRKTGEEQYLPARAWELYSKGRLDELVDESLKGDKNFCIAEARRFLKIGLLCTQERPKQRPAMSVVVRMLNGEINVDNRKIPKPRKLMDLSARASSSCEPQPPPHVPWWYFCGSLN